MEDILKSKSTQNMGNMGGVGRICKRLFEKNHTCVNETKPKPKSIHFAIKEGTIIQSI